MNKEEQVKMKIINEYTTEEVIRMLRTHLNLAPENEIVLMYKHIPPENYQDQARDVLDGIRIVMQGVTLL
jgi:hypothetical protein